MGLGAADFDQLPIGIYKKLKEAKKVFVRTMDHPVFHDLERRRNPYSKVLIKYMKNMIRFNPFMKKLLNIY